MKKYIIYFACLLLFSWGCSSNANKTDEHAGHNHDHEEGHKHSDEHADCDHDHGDDHKHGDEGHEGHDDHDHAPHAHGEANFADEIVFTQEQAKAVGVELLTVKADNFHQVIKTSGQILSAQGDEVTISATSNGIVSFNKASLNEGLAVRGGESLVSISSRNIGEGDHLSKSKTAYQIAEREFNRAESLIGDKLISEKEYNEIRLNYENTKISYNAFSKNQTAKGASVASPISGFVKTKLVNEGEYVEIGQPLMTVTQNRKLQLRADVSERYYKDMATITSANFKTPYDKTIHRLADLNGRMVSYARSASNQEYYLPINFEFNNVGQVVAGSYVEVFLLSGIKPNVISIPLTSLTEEQGIYFVYTQLDKEGYKKQEVKLGINDGERVEILSGLKAGDIVVSKGATYVKLASASTSIPHGHEH